MEQEPTVALTAGSLLWSTVGLLVLTMIAVWVFRHMQRPRLALHDTPDGPRTTARDVIIYTLTTPVFVYFWWSYFTLLILFSPTETSPETLLYMPLALILAVRILAHFFTDAAYHLSSIVPLLLISAIIIGQGVPDSQFVEDNLKDWTDAETSGAALLVIFTADYVITAIWYWAKTRLPGNPGPEPRQRRKRETRQNEHV